MSHRKRPFAALAGDARGATLPEFGFVLPIFLLLLFGIFDVGQQIYVQSVLQGLMQCGVQGVPLDTQELIELYYDSYNPDAAVRQPLQDINNLTADVITRGQGNAPQPQLDRELM